MNERTSRILVYPQKCVGCLICQLQCSFNKAGVFNPSVAEVVISWVDDEPRIAFTDNCDKCGLCARFCPYGALVLVK